MTLKKITLLIWLALLISLVGCATGPSQKKLNDSNNLLRIGDIQGSLLGLEDTNKNIKDKDIPYYLDKTTLLQLNGKHNSIASTENLRRADRVVDDWMSQAKLNLGKTSSEVFSFIFTAGPKNTYQPKDYEKSMISFNLAVTHFLDKQYDNARVAAKKLAERETIIDRLNELKIQSIKEKEGKDRSNNPQASSSINSINGYPVNLINSPEVNSLKNSYQNAAAHYLAGFMFEMQGDQGLAAPGYRIATELKPNVPLFSRSLAELDRKISQNNSMKNTSEVLFIVEAGFIPRISTHKSSMTFNTRKGPRIVTLSLPVIEQPFIPNFVPAFVGINSTSVPISQVVNLDAMSRRQLRDDMPGYVLKATTQAFVQVLAQEAAQAAAERNNNNNNNGAAMFAAILVGVAMSAGDVDARNWSSLPGYIYMGRIEIPKGKTSLAIPTTTGMKNIEFLASENYHIVRVRYLGNTAYVSN
jgi:hypothetical protein